MMEQKLQQLGLSDKESKTYLASLKLGPAPVQEIAKDSQLKRPTVYFAIEQLVKKGLMSSFEKGKKRLFAAESPERLISLLALQKKKAQALEENLQGILPQLNDIFNLTGEKPMVRFFEGKEGLWAIQEDFLKSGIKSMENIYPRDDFIMVFSKREREKYVSEREKRKIKIRTIYTSQKGQTLPNKPPFEENKFVPREKFPFAADITIYGNKVAIGTFRGKLVGIIIESKEIAETLRLVFDLAWQSV